MIMVTARHHVRPECENQYLTLVGELIKYTRTEEGNISYVLYKENEIPGEFVLIEFWKDRESLDSHFKTKHFTEIIPGIRELHARPTEINTYTEII